MSEIKKGIILNYVNMAIGAFIPLIYTPIMLRMLGQDEYGLYKLSGSVTSYLSLLSFGIGSAILRSLIKARIEGGNIEEQRVFSLFLIIYKCVSILILCAGGVIVCNLDIWYSESLNPDALYKMQILVAIMVCQSSMSFLLGPYFSIITAHERYVFLQSIGIFLTIFSPISNLIALFLGYSSIGLAISSFAVSLLGQIIYVWYVHKKLEINTQYHNLPWNLIKEIFAFTFWMFLAQITGLLYNSTDSLMIGASPILGAKAVAVYSIGTVFTGMLLNFTSGISSVLAPRVNRLCFEGMSNHELTDFGIKVGRIQMYIVSLIICGFMAIGNPFLILYAGIDYQDAYWVAILTMIPTAIPLVQNVFMNVITARFQHKFRSIVYLLIAIINVIGTYYILPYWGIVGAALVTGIAALLGQGLAMNWYYYKKVGIEIPRFWKEILPVVWIPCMLSILLFFFSSYITFSWFRILFSSLLFILVWYLLVYRFSFTEYERQMFSLTKFLPLKHPTDI